MRMTPPALFDSHVHLDVAEFDVDRGTVLCVAREAGVREMLIPAIAASGWPSLRDLCEAESGLYPAYGLHPLYLAQHADEDLSVLRDWLSGNHAHAVGECGLDFTTRHSTASVKCASCARNYGWRAISTCRWYCTRATRSSK